MEVVEMRWRQQQRIFMTSRGSGSGALALIQNSNPSHGYHCIGISVITANLLAAEHQEREAIGEEALIKRGMGRGKLRD